MISTLHYHFLLLYKKNTAAGFHFLTVDHIFALWAPCFTNVGCVLTAVVEIRSPFQKQTSIFSHSISRAQELGFLFCEILDTKTPNKRQLLQTSAYIISNLFSSSRRARTIKIRQDLSQSFISLFSPQLSLQNLTVFAETFETLFLFYDYRVLISSP